MSNSIYRFRFRSSTDQRLWDREQIHQWAIRFTDFAFGPTCALLKALTSRVHKMQESCDAHKKNTRAKMATEKTHGLNSEKEHSPRHTPPPPSMNLDRYSNTNGHLSASPIRFFIMPTHYISWSHTYILYSYIYIYIYIYIFIYIYISYAYTA